jgi:predicted component of type VI protein secretion system
MPKLKITLPDQEEHLHELHEDTVTVGRLPDNSLPIEDASVSSHHAQLLFDNGSYKLVDLDSTNGTFVNNQSVTEVILQHGDNVRFGKVEVVFLAQKTASSDKQPLPASGASDVSLGTASVRPGSFVSASPFPTAAKSGAILVIAAILFTALGVIGFAVAAVLSVGLSAAA